jgi:hypothetical protein
MHSRRGESHWRAVEDQWRGQEYYFGNGKVYMPPAIRLANKKR